MTDEIRVKKFDWTPLVLCLIALGICVPLVYFESLPSHDVAMRYAPMADAFAQKNWLYAFHPRVPMLWPVASGIVAWLTGCGGFMACKLVSALFFALMVFPLYGIMSRVFDKRVARWSTVMMIACSHLLRLAYTGLRDTGKGFAFLLAVYGLIRLYRERERVVGYLCCGVGAALLTMVKGDCGLYGVVILVVAFGFELRRPDGWHLPWRSVGAMILALAFVAPGLIYNYRMIGYPVPESRFALVLSRVAPSLRNEDAALPMRGSGKKAAERQRPQTTDVAPKANETKRPAPRKVSPIDFLLDCIKGFYPYFLIFAIPVVILRIRRKQWAAEETILLSTLFVHLVLLVIQIAVLGGRLYVSRRYLLPVSPLLFGWSWFGVSGFWKWIARNRSCSDARSACRVLSVLLLTALVVDGALPIIKTYVHGKKSRERIATLALAEAIRADYDGPKTDAVPMVWNVYHLPRLPEVLCPQLNTLGYLAGGRGTPTRTKSTNYVLTIHSFDMHPPVVEGAERLASHLIDGRHFTVWKVTPRDSE